MLAYLSSEKDNALDDLVYNGKKDTEHDSLLKGKIQAYDAVLMLDEFLYSMELKKQEAADTEAADTRVDD